MSISARYELRLYCDATVPATGCFTNRLRAFAPLADIFSEEDSGYDAVFNATLLEMVRSSALRSGWLLDPRGVSVCPSCAEAGVRPKDIEPPR